MECLSSSQETVEIPCHLSPENADLYINLNPANLQLQVDQIQSIENITEEAAFESLNILDAFCTYSQENLGVCFEKRQIQQNLDPIVGAVLRKAYASSHTHNFDLEKKRDAWHPTKSIEPLSLQEIYLHLKEHANLVPKTLLVCKSLWPDFK